MMKVSQAAEQDLRWRFGSSVKSYVSFIDGSMTQSAVVNTSEVPLHMGSNRATLKAEAGKSCLLTVFFSKHRSWLDRVLTSRARTFGHGVMI